MQWMMKARTSSMTHALNWIQHIAIRLAVFDGNLLYMYNFNSCSSIILYTDLFL